MQNGAEEGQGRRQGIHCLWHSGWGEGHWVHPARQAGEGIPPQGRGWRGQGSSSSSSSSGSLPYPQWPINHLHGAAGEALGQLQQLLWGLQNGH